MVSRSIKETLDPLHCSQNHEVRRNRVLTDKGIQDMLQSDLVSLIPQLKPEEVHKRIQPASIDVHLDDIFSQENLLHLGAERFCCGGTTINSFSVAEVKLKDHIHVQQIASKTTQHTLGTFPYLPFKIESVARSSVVRMGLFDSFKMPFYIDGRNLGVKLVNLTPNSVEFTNNEAIGQLLVKPDPFFDHYMQVMQPDQEPINTELGDYVRSLDMGIEVDTNEAIRYLANKGFFTMPRDSKKDFEMHEGFIILHAKKTAKRMKTLNQTLSFSQRKKYEKENYLYEDIDISKGYTVQEGEVLVVDADEKFELSKHIGVMLYEEVRLQGNVNSKIDKAAQKLFMSNSLLGSTYHNSLYSTNISWADPGYQGIMTGLPKLPGITIYPGDPIGLLKIFYFPNGVSVPYGDLRRNSQYQNQEKFQIGKKS